MNNIFKKGIITFGAISSMVVGGDVSNLSQPIYSINIPVENENVVLSQSDTKVEAKMPWKGEEGITISYDLKPSFSERLFDSKLKRQVTTNVVNNNNGFKIDVLLFEKPNTNKFCYQIKGWENYNFEWQPPLTMEQEEGETCSETQCVNKKGQITKSRPEEIVGSYAIYNKTKKHHIQGQIDYGTGKLGHIPYPYIWEIGKENEKVRAENLNFKDGELCVTAPQEFLDNADYTKGVRIDPTFGYTSAPSSFVLVTANQWYGAKGVPSVDGTVYAVTTYTSRPSGGTTNWKGVITNNSLNILTNGVSSSGTLTLTTPSWRTATYSSQPSVTGSSTYYCGIIPDGNFNQYYDTTGASSGDSKNDTSNSYTTPTDPTDASNLTRIQGTYCTYSITNATWYNASWAYRKKITIDDLKVSTTTASETYANFPMLFDVTDTDLKYTGSSGYVGKSDGTDILFTAGDGTTKLNHELEYYSSTTGRLSAWVNLSTNLSSTTDTDIYVYYGNSGASDQQNATSTWNSAYTGVWHLYEDPSGSAPQMQESTTNNRDMTSNGSMTTSDSVNAQIYKGVDMDGSNDYFTTGVDISSFATVSNFTFSVWMKPSADAPSTANIYDGNYLFAGGSGSTGLLAHRSGSTNTVYVTNYAGVNHYAGGTYTANNWYYVVGTHSGGQIKLYLNGTLMQTTTSGNSTSFTGNVKLGQDYGAQYFPGLLDEARISNVGRTASWIATEYNNQSATSTFYAVSSQQTPSGGGGGSSVEDAFDDFFLIF